MSPRLRVLIVEDEPVLRLALSRMLRETGADVITTGSVEEALAVLDGDLLPGLVLSDLHLGDRLGTEVLERALALGVARRVLCSGDRQALRAVHDEVATDVLAKPVSRAVLTALVGAPTKSGVGLRRPERVSSPGEGEGTGGSAAG